MEEIGNIIYQRRSELGLTLEDVGNAVGVGKSTVRKWEKGMIKNMGRDKIAALAKVLNINPALLIRLDSINPMKSRILSQEEIKESEEDKVLFREMEKASPAARRAAREAALAVLKSMEETNSEF